MPIQTVKCEICPYEFRAAKIHKPFVGMYKGKLVFHWYYPCVQCGYKHTVMYYNEYINHYYDKVMSLKFDLIMHRNDECKVKQLEKECEVAVRELDRVHEEVRRELIID